MDEEKTLDITKFSPPVAELQKVVSETKLVGMDSPDNLKQLKVVKENRAVLKSYRVKITKYGKELRQDALKFQKDVIAKEKELIAIISPEEKRLAKLQDEAEEYVKRQKRVMLIPQRRERLTEIGEIEMTDEELIAMEGTEFEGLLNKLIAEKNERIRIENEEEQERMKAVKEEAERKETLRVVGERAREKERVKAEAEAGRVKAEAEADRILAEENRVAGEKLALEKEEADRIARAKRVAFEEQEAKDRIVLEEKESKERIAQQEQEAKDKIEQEEAERKAKEEAEELAKEARRVAKEDAERAKLAEKEKLESEERYQAWLKSSGYDIESCILMDEQEGKVIVLYRRISSFNRNEK